MTLTSVLPTLRRSIPDPLVSDLWPAASRCTTTDVVVAGVSLLRLSELCETPCVHSAPGVLPGSGGRRDPHHDMSVVVTSVLAIGVDDDGVPTVEIDCRLCAAPVTWPEVRLIGRVSVSRERLWTVRSADTDDPGTPAFLPADLRTGDLLALPAREQLVVRELRSRACLRGGDKGGAAVVTRATSGTGGGGRAEL